MIALSTWIAAALIGPCLGSYATTAALRRAAGKQSTLGRSRCDRCNMSLGLAQTAPIISFVHLRGACSACHAPIDVTHLVGEIAGGIVLLSAMALARAPQSLILAALGMFLIANSVHDMRTFKLPDSYTFMIGLFALAVDMLRPLDGALLGLAAAALTFLFLEAVRRAFILLNDQPGLGFGDVKLMAAVALWTGIATPWVAVLSAVLGLVVSRLRSSTEPRLPFGPCISVAAWLVGMGGEGKLWPLSI